MCILHHTEGILFLLILYIIKKIIIFLLKKNSLIRSRFFLFPQKKRFKDTKNIHTYLYIYIFMNNMLFSSASTYYMYLLVMYQILYLQGKMCVGYFYFFYFGEINFRAEALDAIVAGCSCTRR